MLQQHIQAKHTLEKPFKCDVCAYSHATKAGLKQHVVNSHPKDEVGMLHFWQIFFYYYKEYVILFYTRFYSTSIFVLIERIWTVFECVLPGYTVTTFCKTAKHLNPICELLSTWFHGFPVPNFSYLRNLQPGYQSEISFSLPDLCKVL